MKTWYGKDFKLGVLGAGQLGRMLIQEAINWNVHIYTLDADPEAPCAKISHEFTCGSITDYETVLNFGKDKNLITVEIENVNIEALEVAYLFFRNQEYFELFKIKAFKSNFTRITESQRQIFV
jgi:5-(carboxyamino)imidazole ribonucleotide synthase